MFIIDPKTLKKVKIQSKQGLSLLKRYVKYFQNGGSNDTNNLQSMSLLPSLEQKRLDSPTHISSPNIIKRNESKTEFTRPNTLPRETGSNEPMEEELPKDESIKEETVELPPEIKDMIKISQINIKAEETVVEGTFAYFPPEVSNFTGNFSLQTDIWALGITFLKLFLNFDFYIILHQINKKQTQIKQIIDFAKQTKNIIKLIPGAAVSFPQFIKEDNVEISMKYIDAIKEEQKKYLSEENRTKLDGIFELIKNMIKFKKEDRINIGGVVNELTNITEINTGDITIPFDEDSYNTILHKSKEHSNKTLEDEFILGDKYPMRVYKIGNEHENDDFFEIHENNKREGCNNRNSCSIVKGEKRHNLNELFIHDYLSKKDEKHKYIVDLYTYKIEKTFCFMYIEHVPQALNYYLLDLNKNMRELSKYYKYKEPTYKPGQIAPSVDVDIQKLYELYNEADGVELGGENCISDKEDVVKRNGIKSDLCISKDNNTLTNRNCRKNYPNKNYMAKCKKDLWCKWSEGINSCKLQGNELGQDITCQKYGTKRKCKTSNEELAKMVKQGIDNKIFEEKCIIILKAAEALQFIHDKGILHGDIKPDNIVIQKEMVDNTNKYLVKFIDVGSSRIFMNSKMYKLKVQEQALSEEEEDEPSPDWYDENMFQ